MRRSALRLCSRIVPWAEMLGESTYGRAAGAAVACAMSHAAAGQPQMARGLHYKPAWMPSVAVDFGHKGIDPSRGFASLPDHVPLTMPALSPTMSQGNLSSWKKREGDAIAAGDILAEVETDKATIEWESQDEGFVAKILVPEGTKDIAVGTVVAVIVEDESSIASFANFQPGAAPAEAAAPTPAAAETPAAPSSSYPPHTVVNMPALSPTMSQGTIVSWKKEEGAEVAPGDIFCEVETDKATIEWESQEEGVIAKILVQAGEKDVAVGSPVMVLVDDASQVSAFASYQPSAAGSSPAPAAATPAAAPPTPKPAPTPSPAAPATKKVAGDGSRVIASPYARKLASEAGVSLQGVAGSGPEGRIVAKDVEALIASGGAAGPAPAAAAMAGGDFTDIALTQVKRITAERLLQSKQQIPHYYLTIECQIDKLTKLRAALNSTLEDQGVGKLSVNDFVIKAAALALKKVPEVNSSWMGDFIRQYNNVDVSVAVMTPIGLQVPIVKDADKKGLSGLSSDVKRLVAKAKEGKLAPEEFMGGTFTISNLGMFGIKQFCAIINPPQSCILAVGAPHKKVVLTKQGSYEEVTTIACTLSCDHRVVDGAVGATWLQAFKTYMEDPVNMML